MRTFAHHRWLLAFIAASALVAVGAFTSLGAAPAHASGCTVSWTGAGADGNWDNATNWSTDVVPLSTDNVCITLAGTYKVTLGVAGGVDSTTVASLVLGGTSGTQTLDVHGIDSTGDIALTAASINVGANGAILIDCQTPASPCSNSGSETIQVTSGALDNAGVITSDAPNTVDLDGEVTNTGTINMEGAATNFGQGSLSTPVTLDNKGTLQISTGASLQTTQTVFNDSGGAIDAAGSGTLLVNSGTFDEGAGTTSGVSGSSPVATPVTLINSSDLEFTGGGGASAVTLSAGGGTFTLSGTMAADQSLTVEGVSGGGDPVVDAAAGFTNNGSILIDCLVEPAATPCSTFGSETLQVPSGVMTNNGAITTTAPNTVNLNGNIDNGTSGRININDGTSVYGQGAAPASVTLNNSGVIALADGSLLQTTQAVSNNLDGTVNATGSGTLRTSGQFNEGAGATSGVAPVTLIDGSTLNDTGDGAATFLMQSGGSFGLEGTLANTQTLTVQGVNGTGDTVVTATAGFTNAGAIHLTCVLSLGSSSPCSIFGYTTLQVSSGSMTNSGLITTSAVNATNLDGNIVNTGQITVENTSTVFGQGVAATPPTLDNKGEILLTAGSQLSTDPSSTDTITNDAGGSVVADAGGQLTVNVGTFNQGAGTTSGTNPVVLINNSTLNYTGDGASSILMFEGADFTLSGNLSPADTLTIEGVNGYGDSQVSAGAFTNAGTINISCLLNPPPAASAPCSGGFESLIWPTLTNTGTLNMTAANAIDESGNLINSGTLNLGASGDTAALDLSGNYTQTANGLLSVEVNGPSDASLLDVTGNPTLGGTVSLTPSAAYASSATLGDTTSFLTYTGTRSGVFAHTVLSPTNTALPLINGNTHFGQPPLSCSTGSWTGSPSSFSYQWLRDGVPINGANNSAYAVATADIGHTLTCAVTAKGGTPLAGGNGFGVTYDDAGSAVQSVVVNSFQSGSTTAVSAGQAVVAPGITLGPSALSAAIGANPYVQALSACGGSLPSCEQYSTTTGSLLTSAGAPVAADAQYTFSLVGGTLPTGLTLSAQGFLFGTPTEAGVFNIVVRATDSLGEHGDGVFALTVTPGVSLRTADSSFVLGGAIPAGDASVTPDDGSDPISGVSMSAGGALSVPVSGAANGGGFGLQLSGDGLACNSSLEVTDAAGTLFNVVAVPTTGCASDTVNGTPDVEPLAQAQAPASAFAGAHSAAVAHSAGQLLSSGTISFTSGSPAQTLSLGTSTISTTGIFNATFPPTSTGPVRVQVTGGEYTSELSGTVQTTGFTLSTLVGSTAQLPPIIPVTPLTTLIDNYNPSTPILNPPVVTAKSPYPTNIFTDYGFPTGTIAQQVVPIFTTTVTTNPIAILPILEGGIGTLGVSNRGDLISALQQDIADGVFDGQPNGQPLPLGSATLPINATNTLFATGLSPGDIIPVTTLPVLPPIVSAPIEVIPVSPIPLPTGQAAITRIGPAAFTETLTANAPSGAQAPFSTTSDTFTLEVVAAN